MGKVLRRNLHSMPVRISTGRNANRAPELLEKMRSRKTDMLGNLSELHPVCNGVVYVTKSLADAIIEDARGRLCALRPGPPQQLKACGDDARNEMLDIIQEIIVIGYHGTNDLIELEPQLLFFCGMIGRVIFILFATIRNYLFDPMLIEKHCKYFCIFIAVQGGVRFVGVENRNRPLGHLYNVAIRLSFGRRSGHTEGHANLLVNVHTVWARRAEHGVTKCAANATKPLSAIYRHFNLSG